MRLTMYWDTAIARTPRVVTTSSANTDATVPTLFTMASTTKARPDMKGAKVVYRRDPVWWDQVRLDRSRLPIGLRWVRICRRPRDTPGVVLDLKAKRTVADEERTREQNMECDSQELWQRLRPHVLAIGPLKVLRRVGKRGADVDTAIQRLLQEDGADSVLPMLGNADVHEREIHDAALAELQRVATSGIRLPSRLAAVADAVAMRILDSWAKNDDRAVVAARVSELYGTNVATMVFDGGPGSAQALSAWRLGDDIFLSGEGGAFAIHRTVAEVLAEWLAFAGADISCKELTPVDIAALRVMSDDIEPTDHRVRINARWWRVHKDGSVVRTEAGE